MRLTPLEIKNQTFRKRLRGDDPDEVRSFLELASSDMEELEGDRRRLQERVAELERRLAHFHEIEQSLRDAMMAASETGRFAQQRADEVLKEAEARGQAIVRESEERRRAILAEAERHKQDLLLEAEGLERQRSLALSRMRSLVEDQRALIESHAPAPAAPAPEGADDSRIVEMRPAGLPRSR